MRFENWGQENMLISLKVVPFMDSYILSVGFDRGGRNGGIYNSDHRFMEELW